MAALVLCGFKLLFWMSFLAAPATLQKTQCIQCTNWQNDVYYDSCPMDTMVDLNKVYIGDCDDACFIRVDPSNSTVVVRGCTSYLSLPRLPQDDGCYDWEGETFCICRGSYCNIYAIGKSSGERLDDHLINETTEINDGPLQCYQCVSHDEKGKAFPQCPKHDRVQASKTYISNCTGACFTRSDKGNPLKVFRGCTETQYGLPVPLPPDGCYDWNGEVYCVCTTFACNGAAIGSSSGKDLDYLLDDLENNITEPDGQKRCYSCINYDAEGNYYYQCPKNKRVRNAYLAACNGTCFTRSYHYNDTLVARGCADDQYGLPDPLPADGCYTWNSDVWCVCSTSRCNGKAIGSSSGKDLDYLLDDLDDDNIIEPDGQKRCYSCINYDAAGKYYYQCPKNKRVRSAYLAACNGTCFTRSYDYNDKLVARGCTDTQYGLPDPLPADGCYTWYTEVWCVCSSSRCNGKAIGDPQPIEFDAHIPKDPGDGASIWQPRRILLAISFLFSVMILELTSCN